MRLNLALSLIINEISEKNLLRKKKNVWKVKITQTKRRVYVIMVKVREKRQQYEDKTK